MRKGARTGRCATCASEHRGRIDYLLCAGEPAAAVAREFGLDRHAVWRHARAHVSERMRQAVKLGTFRESGLGKLVAEEGVSVVQQLRHVYSGLLSRWLIALEAGNDIALVQLSKELHRNTEMRAKIGRELVPGGGTSVIVNNTMITGTWLADFGRDLVQLGQDHPEIRPALVALLKRRMGAEDEGGMRDVTPFPELPRA